MHNKGLKYVYIKDNLGELIGYIEELSSISEDQIYVNVISERLPGMEWDSSNRDARILINLDKSKILQVTFYNNYEEFFQEYFEGIF